MKTDLVRIFAGLILAITNGKAAFVSLDLSAYFDTDITSYPRGNGYERPGTTFIGPGYPFVLSAVPGEPTHIAAMGGQVANGLAKTYSVPVPNVAGVTAMYVVVNSVFGDCWSTIGSIGVTGSDGSSRVFDLVSGTNVRSYLYGSFCSLQNQSVGTHSQYSGVLLDAFRYDLTEFTSNGSLPITMFSFNTAGLELQGTPFVAAVTFWTADYAAPEASTAVPLLISMTGGFILMRCRAKQVSRK